MLNKRVEILLGEEDLKCLKMIAERMDRSRGSVIRKLISQAAEELGLRQDEARHQGADNMAANQTVDDETELK